MKRNGSARLRSSRHVGPTISLTPLIDTALVLLVIFMVATPMLKNSIAVNLPAGELKEAQDADVKQAPTVVSIDAQGQFYVNKQMVQIADLQKVLEEKLKQMDSKTVFVDVDETVAAGKLITAMDIIKHLGCVERVVFETEQPALSARR
jgi:biopolymer transport protein ExbD